MGSIEWLLLAFCLYQPPADTPPKTKVDRDRPSIGLALSGGAALGSAHLGVLKQLEAMRVPIDYIAGTSMGSIIGGLYASGLTPDEIEELLTTVDWVDLFTDELMRKEKSWREKRDDRTIPNDFEFGIQNGQVKLPSGIIMGRKLIFTLRRMLLHVQNVEDFDRLPIPFRALATDLETGELVTLGRGDLAKCIRASMSIPGAFSPVLNEDRLLVDGGLVQNLPVEALRELGADIVIAVHVAPEEATREELSSFGAVTGQVITVSILANVRRSMEQADEVVRIDMSGFSGMEFERAAAMIERGAEAGKQAAEQFRAYSLDEAEYAAFRERIVKPNWQPVISAVGIANDTHIDERIILKEIEIDTGQPLDMDQLGKSLDRIYRLGYFQNVDFEIVQGDNDENQLIIHIEEKRWGPNYLKAGLDLVADFSGNSEFNIKALFNRKPLNRLNGELRSFLFLGETPSVGVEWFQPVNYKQTWFTAVSADFARDEVVLFSESPSPALATFTQWRGSVAFGRQFGAYGNVQASINRVGGEADIDSGEVILGGVTLEDPSIDSGSFDLIAEFDRFDNNAFPLTGWGASGAWRFGRESLGADSNYERLEINLQKAVRLSENSAIIAFLTAQSALGTTPPPQDRFFLGGFFDLSGLPENSISGLYGGGFSTAYLHRLQSGSGFLSGMYVGIGLEAGNLWETESAVDLGDLLYSQSILLGFDTAFGPVSLAYGINDGDESTFYFIAGRIFD